MNNNIKISVVLLLVCYGVNICAGKSYTIKPTGDTTEITSQFHLALKGKDKADTIILPYADGVIWESNVLRFVSNLTFILDSGVVLYAKTGIFPVDTIIYGLIRLNNVENINIIGNGSVIMFRIDEYTKGEWRHGIVIEGCKDIVVKRISIINSGGDGIYISLNSVVSYSENILISQVTCDGNARQGISVISCKSLRIDQCTLINTGRRNHHNLALHGPWSGIDLEPNYEFQKLENIIISNCNIYNNKGEGILYAFGGGGDKVYMVANNIYDNKHSGIALIGRLRGKKGEIRISNNKIGGKQENGIYFRDWNMTSIKLIIDSCYINCNQIQQPVTFSLGNSAKGKFGNIKGTNLFIRNAGSVEIVRFQGENAQGKIKRVSITGFKNMERNLSNSLIGANPFLYKR